MPILNMVYYVAEWGGWWQPWANTLAYYKLDWNLNDSSGNERGLTNSWISFQIEDNINCAYCNWWSYAYCQTIPTPSVITISIWAKATNDRSWTYARNLFHTKLASSRQNWLIWVRWEFYSGSGYPTVSVWTSGNVWNESNSLSYSTLSYNDICNRNLWTCVYDNVNYKLSIYRNWQFVSEDTFSTYHPTWNWCDKFSIWVWYVPWNNPTRYWKWWVSETIIEDKARTAQEIADYYNQTKANYGL